MNYTAYHKLQKPLNTEKYNIDIHNTNADIIDSALNLLRQNDISQNNALNSEIERAIKREMRLIIKFLLSTRIRIGKNLFKLPFLMTVSAHFPLFLLQTLLLKLQATIFKVTKIYLQLCQTLKKASLL